MKAKTLMTASAAVYFILGLALLFIPKEMLGLVAEDSASRARLLAQLFGAAMIGLAAMNWVARGSVLGGIYGRALLAGNFHYAFISLLINLRAWLNASENVWLGISGGLYGIFAAGFGYLLFGKPRLDFEKPQG